MRPRGSIVVDEIILPIVDIYLDGGLIVFVGRAWGTFPAVEQRDYVIQDETGRTVVRATGVGGLSWKAVASGSLTVYVPVSFTGREATGCDGKVSYRLIGDDS